MASARFITFMTDLTKIPNDVNQCWISMEATDGYVLDIQRQDDAYVVSHYYSKGSDPFSQYISEASQLRHAFVDTPKGILIKEMILYKDGVCVRQELWND